VAAFAKEVTKTRDTGTRQQAVQEFTKRLRLPARKREVTEEI
jgi:hypothetical protein